MRRWHKASVVTCLAILTSTDLPAAKRQVTEAEVQSVHRSALLIDTHNDVTGPQLKGSTSEAPARSTTPTWPG